MARLVLTGRVRRQLSALNPTFRAAVEQAISDLALEPEAIGRPLLGRLAGLWSARIGNYRLLYTVEGSQASRRVVVRSLLHRGVAYGRRRRRQ